MVFWFCEVHLTVAYSIGKVLKHIFQYSNKDCDGINGYLKLG